MKTLLGFCSFSSMLLYVAYSLPIDIWDNRQTASENHSSAIVEYVLGSSELFPVSNPVLSRVEVPLEIYTEGDIGREPDILRSGEKDLEFTYNILLGRVLSPPRVTCVVLAPNGTIVKVLPFSNPTSPVHGRGFYCYQTKDPNAATVQM